MRALWALAVLAGCAVAPEPAFELPLRDPTVSVASQANAGPDRLAGDWVVLAAAGLPEGKRVTFGPDAMRLGTAEIPMAALGQGRYRIGGRLAWVHWLDADNRTAAMGDPEGGWVWIMDRSGRPGERDRVAREILDWYGYDLARMAPR